MYHGNLTSLYMKPKNMLSVFLFLRVVKILCYVAYNFVHCKILCLQGFTWLINVVGMLSSPLFLCMLWNNAMRCTGKINIPFVQRKKFMPQGPDSFIYTWNTNVTWTAGVYTIFHVLMLHRLDSLVYSELCDYS